MQQDPNRQDIIDFFNSLVANDSRLDGLQNDIGILSLGQEIAFKIDDAVSKYNNTLAEHYAPFSEVVLLSRLLYELGYIRFAKPISIISDIISDDTVVILKDTKFTDGISMYYNPNETSLIADTKTTINLNEGQITRYAFAIPAVTKYYKYDLRMSYQQIHKVEIYFGSSVNKLEFSQAFITPTSSWSFEINPNGNMHVVFRVGGELRVGDVVTIVMYSASDVLEMPEGMSIIGSSYDIQLDNIRLVNHYEPFMSIRDMQNILMFNKNINNSLVYNEDFYNYLLANVTGITRLKVWQRDQQLLEETNGVRECHAMAVWFTVEGTAGVGARISTAIANAVYGRYAIEVAPTTVVVGASIIITNNIDKPIPSELIQTLKLQIIGIYDDVRNKLNENIIYKVVADLFKVYDVVVDVNLSPKGIFSNAKFYNLNTVSVSIVEGYRQ